MLIQTIAVITPIDMGDVRILSTHAKPRIEFEINVVNAMAALNPMYLSFIADS